MLQNQDTLEEVHGAWKTEFAKTLKRIINTLRKTTPFTFPECGGLGISHPRCCDPCVNHNRCSVCAQELTRSKREQLSQIKHSLTLDLATAMQGLYRSLLDDPRLLSDNKDQAVAMAADLERKLLEAPGDLKAYNAALESFLKQGELREISEGEMTSWPGSFNYICLP